MTGPCLSGASPRPQWEELLRAARRREVGAILVWRLERWGRSLVDLVTTLQELASVPVGFVSLGGALVARPVSPFVNSARNEGPRCVEPVASEGLLLT